MALSKQDEFVREFLSIIRSNIIRKQAEANQNQVALAAKAGIGRNTIDKIRRGKNIELKTLLKIAYGLGTYPSQLFLSDEERAERTSQFDQMMNRFAGIEKSLAVIEKRLLALEKKGGVNGPKKM